MVTKLKWDDIEGNRMVFLAEAMGIHKDFIPTADDSIGAHKRLRDELAMALGTVSEYSPATVAAVDWWAETDQPHPMNLESILGTAIRNGTDLGEAERRDPDDVAEIAASFAACVTHVLTSVASAGLDINSLPDDLWDDDELDE